MNPNFAKAFYDRGVVKAKNNDPDGSINDFSRSIDLKLNHAGAYNNRGHAKYISGDFADSISDYSNGIELSPMSGDIYNNRGLAYLMMGQKSEALADFNKAKELGFPVAQEVLDACKHEPSAGKKSKQAGGENL